MCGPGDDNIVHRTVRYDTADGATFRVEVPQNFLNRRVTHWRIAEFDTATTTACNAIIRIPQFGVESWASDAEIPGTPFDPLNASVIHVIPTTSDARGPSSPRPWFKYEATNKQTLPNFFDVYLQWNALPIGSGLAIDATAVGLVDIRFEFRMEDGHSTRSGCQ